MDRMQGVQDQQEGNAVLKAFLPLCTMDGGTSRVLVKLEWASQETSSKMTDHDEVEALVPKVLIEAILTIFPSAVSCFVCCRVLVVPASSIHRDSKGFA